jgi:hypothetical protein
MVRIVLLVKTSVADEPKQAKGEEVNDLEET